MLRMRTFKIQLEYFLNNAQVSLKKDIFKMQYINT